MAPTLDIRSIETVSIGSKAEKILKTHWSKANWPIWQLRPFWVKPSLQLHRLYLQLLASHWIEISEIRLQLYDASMDDAISDDSSTLTVESARQTRFSFGWTLIKSLLSSNKYTSGSRVQSNSISWTDCNSRFWESSNEQTEVNFESLLSSWSSFNVVRGRIEDHTGRSG